MASVSKQNSTRDLGGIQLVSAADLFGLRVGSSKPFTVLIVVVLIVGGPPMVVHILVSALVIHICC